MGFDDIIADMDHDGDSGVNPDSAPINLAESKMNIHDFKNSDTKDIVNTIV